MKNPPSTFDPSQTPDQNKPFLVPQNLYCVLQIFTVLKHANNLWCHILVQAYHKCQKMRTFFKLTNGNYSTRQDKIHIRKLNTSLWIIFYGFFQMIFDRNQK